MKPKTNSKSTEKDSCMTPSYAVKPLLDLIDTSMVDYIWEPASGEGDLLSELEQGIFDKHIHGSTLKSNGQGDFFDDAWRQVGTTNQVNQNMGIITNPPYSIKPQWVERCYQLTDNWALLMPVEAVASYAIQSQFITNGGVSMIYFNSRIDFKVGATGLWRNSSAQFPTCWYVSGFGLEPNKTYYANIKDAKRAFKKYHRFMGT